MLHDPYLSPSLAPMTKLRISEVANLLQVSDDTVRRWADTGRLATSPDETGRAVVEGIEVARFMAERAPDDPARESPVVSASARNRLTGIVTRVVRDTVMAQVELQVGPHRVVSLMSREAADELGLEPGVLAVATVKSTNVGIEIPDHR
jgi:molybdopterin-binding protein